MGSSTGLIYVFIATSTPALMSIKSPIRILRTLSLTYKG